MNIGSSNNHLFCFGLGYSAEVLARKLLSEGWQVSGTCQTPERAVELGEMGVLAHIFEPGKPLSHSALGGAFDGVSHVLNSIPPGESGDTVLKYHGTDLENLASLKWLGYLSTTGVYGNTDGALVTESSPLAPSSARSQQRVSAEQGWQGLSLPLHIFRLAGIYGPGRNALEQVRKGRARRIIKPGHCFGRIHAQDNAHVLKASMVNPEPRINNRGAIYNVCDDEAAPPADVITEACRLMGVEPPAPQPYEEAVREMSVMAKSFWQDNRRVDNSHMKQQLGIKLQYPTYREGLKQLFETF